MSESTLERIRHDLQQLIETAAAEVELTQQETAAALEAASGAPAIAAAYEQGRQDERGRLRALLEAQQEMLGKAGLNSISLATLSRSLEVEP
jgi:phage terminase large subunit-like protein